MIGRPEERLHRRMARGKPDRPWILGDRVQTKGPRVADQRAENATAARQIADACARLVVDSVGDETLETGPGRIDHAEGRIARAGHQCRSLDDPLQDAVERQLGADRDPGLQQYAKPVDVCSVFTPRLQALGRIHQVFLVSGGA